MKKIAQKDSNYTIGHIIVVDDEAELMSALCETLAGQGYEAAGFLTGAEALAVLKEREFDLLLTDLMMPGMDGIELIRAGIEIDPNLIGIIMTGHGTVQTAVEAMKTGAFDYILKPFKLNTLLPLFSRAMQVRNLRLENMQLKETVAIHELGKAIAFSSDLNSILNKIADTALQQCSADEVSIMLPTKGGRELYVAVVRGGRTENLGEHAPIEQGIAGWVARNRELVVFRGEVSDPRMAPIRPRNDIHTAVSMPMLSQSKLVGVLNVNITKSHRQFTLGQLKALSILVSIIAPILENTALYIQIRKAEEEYRSIFENAREGIFRSLPGERFIAANPALARILGYDSPEDLVASVTDIARQIYVNPDDAAEFARIMETQGEALNFECQAHRKNGSRIWISVGAHAVRDEKGVLLYHEGTLEDITERKSSELSLKLAKEILETLNRPNDTQKLINDILHLLKESMGFEAIGIRLREGEDYPYYVTNGFPDHFVEAENYLCARDAAGEIIRDSKGNPYLECRCGNVLCGRTDPSLPFFTEGGSFWTNSMTKHLAEKSEKEYQDRIRNRCNAEGYESQALIPLRSGEEIIGLMPLSDKRQNLFTPDMIRFLEGIGASIGIAAARRRSVEALRESEEKYRLHFENVTDVIFSIDQELRLLDITPSVGRILGYLPEELTGKPIGELNVLAVDHLEEAYSDIRYVLAGNRISSKVYELIAKDGTLRFCEVGADRLLHDGRATAVIGVARDITERKQAEEWLLRERSMVDRIMRTSPAGITVADRDGRIVFANKRAEEILGLSIDKITGLTYDSPEWLITDFDGNPFPIENLPFAKVISSGNPVYGIRHAINSPGGRRVYLSINGAPVHDEKGNINEVVFSIDDVTEQRRAEEEISKTVGKLKRSIDDTIRAMAMVVEERDPYTAGHQERVASLTTAIAQDLNLSEEQINGIRMAGMIHDIGKMKIPAEILSKPTKLSHLELELLKSHAEVGYRILETITFPYPVAKIAYQHHERINGSGYPQGLKGDEILIEARILAVADVVEAMASHRPYRPALGIDAALKEIENNRGILYDTDAVDSCLKLFRENGYQLK
ncbi:MAG: PAS domain S-box protein [Deltaproteobacteria bacterium]|nr:PAS domain S-box protein [Deltaproteobacteria bacterium]